MIDYTELLDTAGYWNSPRQCEAAQAIEALVAENERLKSGWEADIRHMDTQAKEIAELKSAQSEPVAWMVMNGLVDYQLIWSKQQADSLASKLQKDHDLSGSLASFSVAPLYKSAQRNEQGE